MRRGPSRFVREDKQASMIGKQIKLASEKLLGSAEFIFVSLVRNPTLTYAVYPTWCYLICMCQDTRQQSWVLYDALLYIWILHLPLRLLPLASLLRFPKQFHTVYSGVATLKKGEIVNC